MDGLTLTFLIICVVIFLGISRGASSRESEAERLRRMDHEFIDRKYDNL